MNAMEPCVILIQAILIAPAETQKMMIGFVLMQKGGKMAKLPKYFYFRLRPTRKGTAVEIEDASDVDVVEVIRCKDCKHRDAENCLCEGRGWPMQLVPDDGFCDKGERSEE